MHSSRAFFTLFFLIGSLYADTRELYIDLMKHCVSNTIYEDTALREGGEDWPLLGHTMIGLKRLDNIHYCIKEILKNQIPGDFIETGVWRGGAVIFMKAILKAYDEETRKIWVADSFEGLPKPNVAKYPHDKGLDLYKYKILAVPLEEVMGNFNKYKLLDDNIIFLKGFFKDTLPTAPIEKLALLRLDGDLYESTMDALIHLYPKLSCGGFVIIDDYCIDACVKAVHNYRTEHGITDPMIPIDTCGLYWKKSE